MKDRLKFLYAKILRILLSPLHLCPVNRNRVAYAGLTGGSMYEYADNPRYLCAYIRKAYPGRFTHYWIVSHPGRYRDQADTDLRFCRHYSLRAYFVLLTSRVVVTSGSYAPWFAFRKNQILIDTWHGGGAYKKIEVTGDKRIAAQRAEFLSANVRLFTSSCKAATELLFRGALHYRGRIMEAGMPRNDHLVRQETEEDNLAVRNAYGLSADEHILLYAPTYRETYREELLDLTGLLSFLEKDGAHWRIFYRTHRYLTEQIESHQKENGQTEKAGTGRSENAGILNVSQYPDMQQLLCAADILITDYSSCIWDYSFLYRPCYLYVPDLEAYSRTNGFYVDIHQWPYPMAKTQQELYQVMRADDAEQRKAAIDRHHSDMGNCETGQSCERIARRILQVCKET